MTIDGAALEHNAEALTLLEVARHVTAATDLQEVLNRSLKALRRVVQFDGGSIQLIIGGALEMVAANPEAPPEAYAFRLPLGQGFGGWVAATGLPIYSPDATVDMRAHPVGRTKASTSGVRSYFAAPLISQGRTIGIVQIDSMQVDAFPPSVQSHVLLLVSTIAAAVQNAHLDSRQAPISVDIRDPRPPQATLDEVGEHIRTAAESLGLTTGELIERLRVRAD